MRRVDRYLKAITTILSFFVTLYGISFIWSKDFEDIVNDSGNTLYSSYKLLAKNLNYMIWIRLWY